MKLISTLLSIIVLLVLIMAEFDSVNSSRDFDPEQTNVKVPELRTLPNKLLPFEKKWQDNGNQAVKVNKPELKKDELDRTELLIGDDRYQLVGIFKEKEEDFILLKSDNDGVVKLVKNDTLSGGYTLIEINTNMIAFVVNNNRVEYKLFEFKPYDKN